MKVIDKLVEKLLGEFPTVAIVEPSNANANRQIRIKVTNTRLSPLPHVNPNVRYQPYEMRLSVIISYRLYGGNVDNYLTHQAMNDSLILTEMLSQQHLTITDVAEPIKDLNALKAKGNSGWSLVAVGDADLINVTRVGDDFESSSDVNDHEMKDQLMAYEDQWGGELIMTVHRHYPNPLLKQIILKNEYSDEETTIE
ncbi:hypothetical protein [Shewanella halifaxensis]|uniref:hypothetical protein n=1 Tax=Shewanella halifaxensis TaxID=271098 RepID=UPI000D58CE6F|nr:hypothetical protein [Shewanella halifaxensis]